MITKVGTAQVGFKHHAAGEAEKEEEEVRSIKDKDLPVNTILYIQGGNFFWFKNWLF